MEVGRYRVSVHNHGFFRLDGGAMFGAVPKVLWERVAPADELNRILLATRSLVIEDGKRTLLVDLGCGDKWNEKSRSIFCVANEPYEPLPGVTDILLTHLHFDHAGGISRYSKESQTLEPCHPHARHYVSARNYENAQRPNVRERNSYLSDNVDALRQVDLVLTEPEQELWPGVWVHPSDGHTLGLQWVEVTDGGTTLAFPADLVPTSAHLPVAYVMGYDVCAERAIQEKENFLRKAIERSWIVVFEHDPTVAAGRLALDDRGRPFICEELDLR